ncbi:6-bladed beta-propeller, partial [Bacteroides fragilis]
VDLRIIEKAEGTVMSLGDLVESYEVIKLENRDDSAFRSVDLRIIEKAEGTVMSLGDLVESYEVIKLENRD